jgi:ArsR family transcriptional regulator
MAQATTDLDIYIAIFKALSNPHRLRILLAAVEALRDDSKWICDHRPEAACQREYAGHFDIAPSTMSHHLKELANAGLLTIRRDGQRIVWGLNRNGIRALRSFVDKLDP